MTNTEKALISSKISELSEKRSQRQVAAIAGVSPATISLIKNEKWHLLSDAFIRKIKTNLSIDTTEWQTAHTRNFKAITGFLKYTQKQSISTGISYAAGSGKTHTFKEYVRTHDNVYHIQCAYHYSMRVFLQKFMQVLGLKPGGLKTVEMADAIISNIKKKHKPLIIFDEADKLKETAFLFLIDLYNQLDGSCGFVFAGAPFLRKMVEKKADSDKRGFREFYSRIGKTFVPGYPVIKSDVRAICHANSISDPNIINQIFASCEGDLRIVKRAINVHSGLN